MLASSVMIRSRAMLNDTLGDVYTDPVLLPYLQNAWGELQSDLQQNGLPVTTTDSAVLTIPAGTFKLTSLTTPPVPADIVDPIALYERAIGTPHWSRMTEYPNGLMVESVSRALGPWRWENDGLRFGGSDSDRELKIRYTRTFAEIDSENTNIPLNAASLFLAYRTAAEAAEYIGQNTSRASSLDTKAQIEKSKYIATRVNGLQAHPVRRRGFISAARSHRRGALLPY